MILNSSIERVIDAARIEEVVRSYVDLKSRGSNLLGLCPFHKEKTPSFTVSPSKNIYKCFGCGKAGDPVRFVMEADQLSFPEAIRALAKRYNITLEETKETDESKAESLEIEGLNIVNQWACSYYQDQLWNTDEGKSIGLSYFKERGFLDFTLQKFQIGYAPEYNRALAEAASAQQYSKELLQKLGLVNSFGSDFFRQRVIFPIHHQSGKVIGFAGRVLASDSKLAKYINSPETEVYKKNKTLFGLHLAKQSIRKNNRCILVEGYTDVMSLHQSGIENVVASSGTSLTEEQAILLKRHTENVTILYDGDAAGIKAALRGIDIILKEDLNVQIVLIPDGDDPDSYLKKVGGEEFETFVQTQAKDFILFKMQVLQDEIKDDPIAKANAIKDILNSISKINDPIKRSLYIQHTSEFLKVDEATLIQSTNKIIREEIRQKSFRTQRESIDRDELISNKQEELIQFKSNEQNVISSGDEHQEKEIVRILILTGNKPWQDSGISTAQFVLDNIQDIQEYFDNNFYLGILQEVYNEISNGKIIDPQFFLQHHDSKIADLAIELSTSPFIYSDNWAKLHGIYMINNYTDQEYLPSDIEKIIKQLKYRKIQKIIQKLDLEINKITNPVDQQEMIKVREEYKKIKNQLYSEVWNLNN